MKVLESRIDLRKLGEILLLLHKEKTIKKDLRSSNVPLTFAEMSKKFTQKITKDTSPTQWNYWLIIYRMRSFHWTKKALNQLKQKQFTGQRSRVGCFTERYTRKITSNKVWRYWSWLSKKKPAKTRGRAGLSEKDAKKMEKNLDNKTVLQRLHWFIYSYCKSHHETMHNRYSFPIARSSFCMSFNSFG